MRRASLLLVVASLSACAIEPKEQLVFEDGSQPAQTAERDWNGEPIVVHNDGIDDGVNNPVKDGGIELTVSSTATKISVQAVFAAHADDDKEPNARQSIADALETFSFTQTAAGYEIRCGHGETHGTSRAAGSGCKTLRVTIPAGRADQPPHTLAISNGSGALRVGALAARAADSNDGSVVVANLRAENTGAGEVAIRVRPAMDAVLTIAGEKAVTIALPTDFSAKNVVLTVPESGSVVTAFPGLASGSPYPPTGPTEDAIAELAIRSNGPVVLESIGIAPILNGR